MAARKPDSRKPARTSYSQRSHVDQSRHTESRFDRDDFQRHVASADANFTPIDQEFHNEEARVLQHEIDHLDGRLFIDLLESPQDLYYMEEFKEYALPELREILKTEAEES